MALSAPDEIADAAESVSVEAQEARLAERLRRTEVAIKLVERLTEREKHIAAGAALGLGSKQISYLLGISSRTVELHSYAIHKKWKVINRYQVARVAVYAGLDVKFRHIYDVDGELDDVLDRSAFNQASSPGPIAEEQSAN